MCLLIENELESEAKLAAGGGRISVACENYSEVEREVRLVADGERVIVAH